MFLYFNLGFADKNILRFGSSELMAIVMNILALDQVYNIMWGYLLL